MLHEKIDEFTEAGSFKPVKRVRFSDELQNVFEFYGIDEKAGSISMENKSNAASVESVALEQVELFTEEVNDIGDDENKSITDNADKPLSDNVIEVSELPSCNENINESDSLYKDDFQTIHDFVNKPVKFLSSTVDSVPDTNSLNELINNTNLMTISLKGTTQSENMLISPIKLSLHESSSETASEKSILQIPVEPFDQKSMAVLSHKRSLEEMQIEKQTSKLNSCLRKNNSEFKSADELKTAVFNAWYKVKNEKSVSTAPCIPEVKKIIDTSRKKSSNNAYETWKTSKKKAKKTNSKIPEPVSRKTEEDLEESKMAFQAWKKKKDELLKQQIAEKYKKEEKKRLDSLMNERIRKNDAESAYSAWNAHKAVVSKMEKKKNQWFLEKEKEKLQDKIQKNDEAAKVYYEWLRSKIYFSKANTYKVIRDKPPWTPPGKANSSI